MTRAHNFCAGPAALPESVLQRAREELLDWHGSGSSIMEMSHRSPEFTAVIEGAEAGLRRLLGVTDDYAVLFLQGGATQQFSAVPLNLVEAEARVDYAITGHWSKKAEAEARRFADARVVVSSEADGFRGVPPQSQWQLSADAAYIHYCPNETIAGVEFDWIPDGSVPLVVDMSSTLLSRPIDVARYGVIYAGAQKNIGPAGLTLVLVHRELLGRARAECPTAMNWQVAADNGSMFNTPPTFSIYLAGLVFDWLEEQGGLEAMERVNRRKAGRLYGLIDGSDFYANPVSPDSRSMMNVPFTLAAPELDAVFLREAAEHRLLNLKGHRSIGGMRASIYNAVSEGSVEALCDFMSDFEQRHG